MSSDRRMVYPVTLTAKIVQFPYKFYYNNSWAYKYWIWGAIVSLPLFYKLQKLSYAPGNVAKFEALARKEHEEHLKHLDHLL